MIVQTIDIVSPETAAQIRGAVKTWVSQSGEEQFLAGVKDISVFSSLKEIMADDTIDTSSAEAAMHQVYPYMDRTIHRTTDYLFGISMYSSRISNCEIMNDENLKGWFTGFGMTYLYNDDKQQYTDHFWDTVDPLRLPGTTIVAEEVDNGEPDSSGFHQGGDFLSPENWGGRHLDRNDRSQRNEGKRHCSIQWGSKQCLFYCLCRQLPCRKVLLHV